jgi:murein DD-endopeptidase MepM/ murein hydrolase activator NlpD
VPHLPAPADRLGNLTAGWRYSNGGDHFAHDYAMKEGTPLYAVRAGKISDQNNGVIDYTPNRPGNKPGQQPTGSPSNWILLKITYEGRPATVYYQHLKRTVVKDGQTVKEGQIIGYSGQTGNATGPHLHIAAMRNKAGSDYNIYSRYTYMINDGKNPYIIYPPSKTWGSADIVNLKNLGLGKKNADVLVVQKALAKYVGLDYSSGPGTWGAKTQAAWLKAAAKSGKTGLSLLRHLGYLYKFTGEA